MTSKWVFVLIFAILGIVLGITWLSDIKLWDIQTNVYGYGAMSFFAIAGGLAILKK